MTLILSTPWGIYGDRKITADTGERCDPIRKIAGNEEIVAGFAGHFPTILKAIEQVKNGEVTPKVLAKCEDEGILIEGLLIRNGRTYFLDTGRAWVRPKREVFYACGTGATPALAYLSGICKAKKKFTDADIKSTFRYVAKVRDDCGPTFDFLPC